MTSAPMPPQPKEMIAVNHAGGRTVAPSIRLPFEMKFPLIHCRNAECGMAFVLFGVWDTETPAYFKQERADFCPYCGAKPWTPHEIASGQADVPWRP